MFKVAAPEDSRVETGTYHWLNLDSPSLERLKTVLADYPFHPLDLEDCLSKTQLPKVNKYKDYLFIIFHFPRYLKDRQYSVPMQLAIFLGRDFLVTVHNGELKPINRLFAQCRDTPDSCPEHLGRSSAFLLYTVIHSLVQNLFLMAGKVLDNLEVIEEKVFDEKVDAVREVTGLRHNIANLRRIVFPLKQVVHELERRVTQFANEDTGVYFRDLADDVDRVWSALEECKETIEIYKDTDYIISSDRTNKILGLLTIVFTLSIPASVIGTFFGMNVNLPGGAQAPWMFWGQYTTLILIATVSLVPALVMYLLFRRLKWL